MYWAKGRKTRTTIYSTQDIYRNIMRLMNEVQIPARVTHIDVTVTYLEPLDPIQLGIFDNTRLDAMSLAQAVDKMNDRYGEFTVVPALMANMDDVIIKRVPFGSVRDL
jgi:DNA polymerase-4